MEKTLDKNENVISLEFDINKFKICLDEYLCKTALFKNISDIIQKIGICIALYYKNMEYADEAYCKVMISGEEVFTEKTISYTAHEQEKVIEQLTNVISKKVPIDEKNIKCNTIRYRGNPEFSDDYLIVFAAFNMPGANESQKAFLLRQLIVDFLYQIIDDIKKLELLSKEEKKYLSEQKYNFIERYKQIVIDNYKLPSETIFEKISRTGYENRICTGQIIFVGEKEADRITRKFDPSEDYKITNEQLIRKLLETAKGEYYMAVDKDSDYRIAGYMKINDKNNWEKGDIYISFKGASNYSIISYPEEVLLYKNGEYYASREDNEEANRKISEENGKIPGLKEILSRRDEIEHGALIIFAEDAEAICEKLCKRYKRGYVIEPFYIKDDIDFLIRMTAVDGAVLADKKGKCYAYGVILDGQAQTKGTPERGSRYNSAIDYIYNKDRVAVIISEDKDKPVCVKDGIRLFKEENG